MKFQDDISMPPRPPPPPHTHTRTSRNQYVPNFFKVGGIKRAITHFFQYFSKYFSHHPLSAGTSFNILALILFETWHLQNFISIFSKGCYLIRGDNSNKNKCLLFFHEESIHEVSRRYLIPEYHSCKTSLSKIRVCYFSMRNPYMKFQDDISFRNIIAAKVQCPTFTKRAITK